jgi:hypothetical protein
MLLCCRDAFLTASGLHMTRHQTSCCLQCGLQAVWLWTLASASVGSSRTTAIAAGASHSQLQGGQSLHDTLPPVTAAAG